MLRYIVETGALGATLANWTRFCTLGDKKYKPPLNLRHGSVIMFVGSYYFPQPKLRVCLADLGYLTSKSTPTRWNVWKPPALYSASHQRLELHKMGIILQMTFSKAMFNAFCSVFWLNCHYRLILHVAMGK